MNISTFDFTGKKALIRVDFNVPLDKTTLKVTDDTRISAAVPTIKKVLDGGGAVILMSHLGRPDGEVKPSMSLGHILSAVKVYFPDNEILFATDSIGEDAKSKASNLKSGEILILENLRFYKEEEEGNESFAQDLASLGDVYINDAFGTAHRAHASTSIIAQYFTDKMFGYLMTEEVSSIEKVMREAQRPFTAIVGGSKVSDKVGIIENLIEKADNILIGGAMAYTFAKALGGEVGNSRIEADKLDLAKSLVERAKSKGVALLLPSDSISADEFSESANKKITPTNDIPANWMGLDIGPDAINDYKATILNSKTILWNGPMGVFEMESYAEGTKSIAYAVAEATKNGAYSLIGGGDSVTAINKFGLQDEVSYISTGGGAMLECLEGKVLPGVSAIVGESEMVR